MPRWYLESSEINGGFLPGLSVQFPRGLTCIIGPRGSGKSTLLEALRFGIGGVGGASKARLELIQANLSEHTLITIQTLSENGESGYTVRRSLKQSPSLISHEGKPITTVDLDRGTFLPLDGYSAGEIEQIANDSIGEKRRSLLDELRSEELTGIHLSVAGQRRALEANADKIRATRRLVDDLTEHIEEMGDVRARLEAVPPAAKELESEELTMAARQSQINSREARLIDKSIDAVTQYTREVHRLSEEMSKEHLDSTMIQGSTNLSLLLDAEKQIQKDYAAAVAKLNAATLDLGSLGLFLSNVQNELTALHAVQDAQYIRLQEENSIAGRNIQERTLAEQAVSQLDLLEKKRLDARTELLGIEEERKKLKGDYLLERERVSELREQVAADLQSEAGPNVRIRIRRSADSLSYQQMLTEALRGARVRNQDEIVKRLMRLRPEQLAQLMADNRPQEFESQMSLGEDRSKKVLDSLRINIDPLELEIVNIDDRIYIELNVGTAAEPNFKDASELSRGQKCTALLPLLLARRDSPLVIDQPEDNLDNHFIYETVVETIQRMKNRRQMVFVTHNANIPVLAEADLVVVLNSDGKIGYVEKAGTLDECREEIIDLLEGGREAFELRRRRYAKQ